MNKNNLILKAFGEWKPGDDSTAALKFCLNAIIEDGDFDWLIDILQATHAMQFQGDPGWELERRLDDQNTDDWPIGMDCRASVPVGILGIERNEVFVDIPKFMSILGPLLSEYKKRPSANNEDFFELVRVFQAQCPPPSSPSSPV